MLPNDRVDRIDPPDGDTILEIREQKLTRKNTHVKDIERISKLAPFIQTSPIAMRALSVLATANSSLHNARDLADSVISMLESTESGSDEE